MTLSNKTYDILKYVAMVFLPAFILFYLGLGQVWAWPKTEEVGASLSLLEVFLGSVLLLNSARYKKDPNRMDGFLTSTGVDPDTGHPNLQLVVTTDPNELLRSKNARLMIGEPPEH